MKRAGFILACVAVLTLSYAAGIIARNALDALCALG